MKAIAEWLCCVGRPGIFSAINALLLSACSSVKPVSEYNLAHLYASNPQVRVQFSLAAGSEDIRVFCQLDFPYPEALASQPAFWQKYRIGYELRPGYESSRVTRRDSIGADQYIKASGSKAVFQILLPMQEDQPAQVLVLKIALRNGGEELIFPIYIPEGNSPAMPRYALFRGKGKVPVAGNLVRAGDTLSIRPMDFRKSELRLDYCPFNQAVAMPPMASVSVLDSSEEKLFPVSAKPDEQLIFRESGFYRVRDEDGNSGFSFLLGDEDFPMLTRAEELLGPMIYISTRDERKTLVQAENIKLALDQFWLKISPQKDRARELIKRYFVNIENANRNFSTFKEGWKTDRGMVLAIFGPPLQVFRQQDTEIWIYDKSQNPETAIFYFFRRKAADLGDIWELRRQGDYDKIWYGVVDLWRKGIIDR
jgi:GWxTD domain-containing protein